MKSSHTDHLGHIAVLEPSSPGASFLPAGDIHGNLNALKKSASLLTAKGDTLLIAGDLTDRGDSSLDTLKFIHQFNAKNPDFQIRSIRGNHEDLCLDEISALEKIAKLKIADDNTKMCLYLMSIAAKESRKIGVMLGHRAVSPLIQEAIQEGEKCFLQHYGKKLGKRRDDAKILAQLDKSHELKDHYTKVFDQVTELYQHIVNHAVNGGKWLSSLYIEEFEKGLIKLNQNGEVEYNINSDVVFIKKFMSALPYIIHVPGVLNVVHADMPFNNEELQRRIASGKGLTKDEILYATLARANDRTFKIKKIEGCDSFSLPIYCGHTEKGGVRPETNTFNLDVSTHSSNVVLVVNHTKRTCELVCITDEKPSPALESIRANTQLQLDKQNELALERQKQSELKSAKEALPTLKKAPSSFFYSNPDSNKSDSKKIHKMEFKK